MYGNYSIAASEKVISNDDDQEAVINIIQQETSIQKYTIQENIDKTHTIGKSKQGKQQRTVKFKTDSFKEIGYYKHENRIKMTKQNQQHGNPNSSHHSPKEESIFLNMPTIWLKISEL